MPIDRRQFVQACSSLGLTGLFPGALYTQVVDEAEGEDETPITTDHIADAETIAGISFSSEERELLVDNLNQLLGQYQAMREHDLPNNRAPAVTFDPRRGGAEIPHVPPEEDGVDVHLPSVERPSSPEDLAYASIPALASLLRSRRVTSVELTELYLERLRRYDDALRAVLSYTETRALEAARQADAEMDAGEWRGPLHGVPYGAKDLLAVKKKKRRGAPGRSETRRSTRRRPSLRSSTKRGRCSWRNCRSGPWRGGTYGTTQRPKIPGT